MKLQTTIKAIITRLNIKAPKNEIKRNFVKSQLPTTTKYEHLSSISEHTLLGYWFYMKFDLLLVNKGHMSLIQL